MSEIVLYIIQEIAKKCSPWHIYVPHIHAEWAWNIGDGVPSVKRRFFTTSFGEPTSSTWRKQKLSKHMFFGLKRSKHALMIFLSEFTGEDIYKLIIALSEFAERPCHVIFLVEKEKYDEMKEQIDEYYSASIVNDIAIIWK